ncbi:unnamed protein product [Schistocephalus solidus]|uniref:Uncharacterized protein n=1 Tax=Schistocephalus solidus TaxID=70667 RepID=A0A183SWF6_SCHSO|nr:unnamed protein product [Schistocephalus solidus]
MPIDSMTSLQSFFLTEVMLNGLRYLLYGIIGGPLCSGLAGGSSDGSSALDELIHRWLNQVTSYSPPLLLSAGIRGSFGGQALDEGAAWILSVGGGGGGAESGQEQPVVTARIPRFCGL